MWRRKLTHSQRHLIWVSALNIKFYPHVWICKIFIYLQRHHPLPFPFSFGRKSSFVFVWEYIYILYIQLQDDVFQWLNGQCSDKIPDIFYFVHAHFRGRYVHNFKWCHNLYMTVVHINIKMFALLFFTYLHRKQFYR